MTDFCTIVNVGLEAVSFIILINESIMTKNENSSCDVLEILKSHSLLLLSRFKKTHC